jgi:hypothetical protein
MLPKLILATLFFLVSSEVMACGCSSPTSLSEVRDWGFAFTGEVVAVERTENDGVIKELVTFRIIKSITDSEKKSVRVVFFKNLTSCDLVEPNFKKGENYTITTRSSLRDDGVLYSNFCDLRQKN